MSASRKKDRTYRFKSTKKDGVWMCLVFEEGIKGVARYYRMKIIKDAYGKSKIYCSCPKQYYSKTGECHHVDEFNKYMEKLIAEGKTSVTRNYNEDKNKGKG